jgi:filamentous hemagglutinin family protein
MPTNAIDTAARQMHRSSRHVRRAAGVVPGGSTKIRLGGSMMLLVWRTRARVARLLHCMLARYLRYFSIGAAATIAVLGAPMAMGAPLAANALPTGGTLVAGQAALSQTANTLNVVQTSKNAILNWNTFNIGAGATVNFQQPNATSATLNRVTTNDPSALMGRLTANGKVWLINPAGIMVGKDARIDVAGFVASTLHVRDEDFLANRLNFSSGAGAGKIQNFGAITTASGGSVYLVGAHVENQGVITAPGGEVLLAAGKSVHLVDTGTPGVRVEVTGNKGAATNLGQILSVAGRIGLAGVLVKNAGVIDASSASNVGGRIFLQASGSIVTAASSTLSVDGTTGGTITLAAGREARIDGSLSAQGLAGHGGIVEISGKTQLSVATAPSIGLGGEWRLIGPNNIRLQAAESLPNAREERTLSSTDNSAVIATGLIEATLNAGTSVTIRTGSSGANAQGGDITVASSITKSSALESSLTLSAGDSIFVNRPITSTDAKLDLSLIGNATGGKVGSVHISSALDLDGGAMNVAGPLVLNGASLSGLQLNAGGLVRFVGDTSLNADVTLTNAVLSGGTLRGTGKLAVTNLNWSGGTILGGATSPAYDVTNLTLSGAETLDGRTLNLVAGGVSRASSAYLTFKNSAVLNNAGALTVADGSQLGYGYSRSAGSSAINNTGTVNSINTSNYWATNSVGGKYDARNFTAFNNLGTVRVINGTLQFGGGGALVNNGQIRVDTGATLSTNYRDLTNAPAGVLSGTGTLNLGGSATLFNNGAVEPGTLAATGTLTVNGNYTQGSTGNLVTRVGGVAANQHDLLQVSGDVKLDGTLTATALNNYVARASDAVTLIGSTRRTSVVSGTFRTVTAPADLYAGYGLYSGAPFRLTYAPGGAVFFSNGGGDFSWSNPLNWSGRSLPVLTNDVQINSGYTVRHGSGNDAISSLTIEQNNGLGVSGGAISVANLTRVNGTLAISSSGSVVLNGGLSGTGLLAVNGGSATLKEVSNIANLAVTSGVLSGDSDFTVSNSFNQTGGSLNFQNATVDLRQNTGDLVIGNLSAASAKLQAVTGAILEGAVLHNVNSLRTQSFASVIVNGPPSINVNSLTTLSARGTRLDSAANAIGAIAATNTESGDVTVATTGSLSIGRISNPAGAVGIDAGAGISQTGGITAVALRTSSGSGTRLDAANAVSRFSATNATSGDIVLVNTTRPTALSVAGVVNNGGSVVIDNTGAILTTGDITAAKGALSLTAHSPITVSSILAARDGITLNALPSPSAADTIEINGTLTSAAGSIGVVAGTSALVAGSATFSVSRGSAISLTALAGAVAVHSGATFIGATPTITQSLPTPLSPPVGTPLPVVALVPPPIVVVTLPTPGLTPVTAPLPGATGALPTTIDSIQKTTVPFGTATRSPALLSIVDAGGGTGSSSGNSVERQTIGGSVDSFGGVASSGKNANDSDNAGGAPPKAAGTEAGRPARSLPVCS